mmetsp:Transcript_133027/g.425454  ORF Transcript_133027/g.425454 Transcript_133027/m.425454 type:complete len:230 (-) Transcript_133027:277-966(-)
MLSRLCTQSAGGGAVQFVELCVLTNSGLIDIGKRGCPSFKKCQTCRPTAPPLAQFIDRVGQVHHLALHTLEHLLVSTLHTLDGVLQQLNPSATVCKLLRLRKLCRCHDLPTLLQMLEVPFPVLRDCPALFLDRRSDLLLDELELLQNLFPEHVEELGGLTAMARSGRGRVRSSRGRVRSGRSQARGSRVECRDRGCLRSGRGRVRNGRSRARGSRVECWAKPAIERHDL